MDGVGLVCSTSVQSPLALSLWRPPEIASPELPTLLLNSLDTDEFLCMVSRSELKMDRPFDHIESKHARRDPIFEYVSDFLVNPDCARLKSADTFDTYQEMAKDLNELLGDETPNHVFVNIPQGYSASKVPPPRLANDCSSNFEKNEVESWINEVLNVASQPGEYVVSSPSYSSRVSFDMLEDISEVHFWLDSSLQSIDMQDILSGNSNIACSDSGLEDGFSLFHEDTLHELLNNSTVIPDTENTELPNILPENYLIADDQGVCSLPINDSALHCVIYSDAGLQQNDNQKQANAAGNSVADPQMRLDWVQSLQETSKGISYPLLRNDVEGQQIEKENEKLCASYHHHVTSSPMDNAQLDSPRCPTKNLQFSRRTILSSAATTCTDTACEQTGAVQGLEVEHAKTSAQKGRTNRSRSRKQKGKAGTRNEMTGLRRTREPTMVDLRTLLVNSAQAVAVDDVKTANEILHKIWLHASPFGNGMQRLAHYFAEGLFARLSGTGGRLWTAMANHGVSAAQKILKAYHVFVAVCPFLKLSHFFANQAILNAAEGASRLHIVDFNILYGFQWPCLIQALSEREGGPPLLRITGIDIPRPGLEPAERVEETGRRLEEYARLYGVPFEYQAIASKWEEVQPDSLQLRHDEVLVVNCIYRLRHLMDETMVAAASPRKMVLSKIRNMNPNLFVEGVVNAGYNAPFFLSRFREALFHYSSVFDALDSTIRSDLEERFVIEREIMGREILNVVACEGMERLERPETYRQWQSRTERAGFEMLPLDPSIKVKAQALVKGFYHKDYGVEDEDGRWLLLGWKGRILHGISTWKPRRNPN
eukprot:c24994_g1_i1 orf=368-2836(+)